MTNDIPLWIIAVCAVVWTVKMVLHEILMWMGRRWPYGGAPKWVKAYSRIVSGVR